MADKKTCFVIMPFKEPYKGRCERIYKPAIEAAGLTPHLAGAPGVDDIIVDIEEGIGNSLICLADISIDNPNVFYELGIAHARMKSVAKVCEKSKRPENFPFDIASKRIMSYKQSDSGEIVSVDFPDADFRDIISEDLKARAAKAVAVAHQMSCADFQKKVLDNLKAITANIVVSADADKVAASSHTQTAESTGQGNINADPKQVGRYAIDVLGKILVICDDGTMAATLKRVDKRMNLVQISGMEPDHRIEEALMTLRDFHLIEQKGIAADDTPAYEPAPGAKEWYYKNR